MINMLYSLTNENGFTVIDSERFEKDNLFSFFLTTRPTENFETVEQLMKNMRKIELLSSVQDTKEKLLKHYLFVYDKNILGYFKLYNNYQFKGLNTKQQIKLLLSKVVLFNRPSDIVKYYKQNKYDFTLGREELRGFFSPIRRIVNPNDRESIFIVERIVNLR